MSFRAGTMHSGNSLGDELVTIGNCISTYYFGNIRRNTLRLPHVYILLIILFTDESSYNMFPAFASAIIVMDTRLFHPTERVLCAVLLLSLNSWQLIHPSLFSITSTRLVKCGIRVVDGWKWFSGPSSTQRTMKSVIFSFQLATDHTTLSFTSCITTTRVFKTLKMNILKTKLILDAFIKN